MSGHNKWSQIKRQKGVADAKRGQIFTKLAKIVSLAAKQGGGDPTMNPTLRVAIEQARAENMPKDNIERAIKRGTGELGGAAIEEMRFEAYGPGGVGILIDVATDNHMRSNAEIKAALNKLNGKLAIAGAVAYQFVQKGILILPITGQPIDRDNLELAIIEAGADNYDDHGDIFSVQTDPKALFVVKELLEAQGLKIDEAKLSWEPTMVTSITDVHLTSQIIRLMHALEDLDDVTSVTGNFEFADEILAQLG